MNRTGSRRDQKRAAATALLRVQFGLSEAETAIALALAEGQAIEDISNYRNVSLHTVRSQLKSVFLKTGAKSQAQLIALIFKSRW